MVQRATNAIAQPIWLVDLNGDPVDLSAILTNQGNDGLDKDTNGDPVPTYKPHTYTYDGSGNLATDTVSDGSNTWVRTYTYTNGAQTADSGWVKQ